MKTSRLFRLIACLVAVCLVSSCMKAVVVPMAPEPKIESGAHYRVVMKDTRKFDTRDLVLTEEKATFTSHDERYSFERSEIDQIMKIEHNGERTFLALLVTSVVLIVGLYLIHNASSDQVIYE